MGVTIRAPRITMTTARPCDLEHPVQRKGKKDGHGRGEQIAENAEAEERLVRGDVVCRRRRAAADDQLVLNVDEPQGSGQECEIKKPCNSGVTPERCHVCAPTRIWVEIRGTSQESSDALNP